VAGSAAPLSYEVAVLCGDSITKDEADAFSRWATIHRHMHARTHTHTHTQPVG